MKIKIILFFYILSCLFLLGCSFQDATKKPKEKVTLQGEYIYRLHNEHYFLPPAPEKNPPEPYPWEKNRGSTLPRITKEYFRCKGSSLNPVRTLLKKGERVHYTDCGGSEKHSLPLRDNKEFIYPVLIDLLNYLQKKTGRRVVITSGHRCPEHNAYIYSDKENPHSKHLMGAEVSFYVQGMENQPERIIQLLQNYYQETPRYQKQKEYIEFTRYEKKDTDVSTQPWLNKEIFIKLYLKKEGRDQDNRHPYPYISVQVRYDRDLNEKVIFTWPKGYNNFYRK